jgi:Phosphatidylethanolamine-binding protein
MGYHGPRPPAGKPHRYFFKLFALDRPLDLTGSETKDHVLRAMHGHVLAEAQLMGTVKHGGSRDIPDDLIAKKHLQDPGAIRTAPLE